MQGLLFPFGHDFGGWVVLLVLVLAVAGTLMAIPTGCVVGLGAASAAVLWALGA